MAASNAKASNTEDQKTETAKPEPKADAAARSSITDDPKETVILDEGMNNLNRLLNNGFTQIQGTLDQLIASADGPVAKETGVIEFYKDAKTGLDQASQAIRNAMMNHAVAVRNAD